MPGFQSTVALIQGFGIPGEIYLDTPMRAQSYTINSATAANNVFGHAFSITAQGFVQAGNPSPSTAVYAGILVNPKGSASYGTSAGGPLAATLTLANFAQGEIASMGTFFAFNNNSTGTANIGDVVVYTETTGALTSIAPGVSLPSGTLYANAYVDVFTATTPGLMVITLNPVTPAVVQ
jgi:hypothetical protein